MHVSVLRVHIHTTLGAFKARAMNDFVVKANAFILVYNFITLYATFFRSKVKPAHLCVLLTVHFVFDVDESESRLTNEHCAS